MSTVVALGHFCEVHGPRLVFYTIRNANEPQFISQCPSSDFKFCSGCKAPILEGYISTVQTVSPSTVQQQSSPSSSSPSSPSSSNSSTAALTSSTRHHHHQQHPHSHSQQHQPTTTQYYCSHSNYDHSHLNHLHTCISRTLSCELSPSNSVAFTSSGIWAIGTAFSLKDSQARGFHRKYCLVFTFLPATHELSLRRSIDHSHSHSHSTNTSTTSKGKIDPGLGPSSGKSKAHHHQHHTLQYPGTSRQQQSTSAAASGVSTTAHPSLVPYYDYITEEFFLIAKSIQIECEKVFFKEQNTSPQRASRLNSLLLEQGQGQSSGGGTSSGCAVFTRSHITGAGARSLPLLTANPHVFLDMHEKFAKVLHHVDL